MGRKWLFIMAAVFLVSVFAVSGFAFARNASEIAASAIKEQRDAGGVENCGNGSDGPCYGKGSIGKVKIWADALSMTEEEFREARRSGKTIAEIAKEKGIEQSDLVEKVITVRAERLKELVNEGKFTQEEADQMLERMRQRINDRLDDPAGKPEWAGKGCSGAGPGSGMGYGRCGN